MIGASSRGLFIVVAVAVGAAAAIAGDTPPAPSGNPPEWAYPLNRNGPPKPPAEDGQPRRVPNSAVELPLTAMRNRFAAVDWHPEGHPQMPEAVAHGRKPEVFACAFCHYPNGQGRPENSSLAGLREAYIVEQVRAVRDGQRRSAQPAMLAPQTMTLVAAHASDEEVAVAAAYFAGLSYKPWIRVVETDTVPRIDVFGISMYGVVEGGGTEPIGERIVEVPENLALTELRDDASGFVAYVPPGSIQQGNALVHATAGGRAPCATCHGDNLKGSEIAPPLAGRSPSYLYRQLNDIRQGVRTGPSMQPMQGEVAGLSDAEMRAIVAYLASLQP